MSDEKIDHAAEAIRCIGYSWSHDAAFNHVQIGAMVEAQVHATLALVEQQRIANLIRAAKYLDEPRHWKEIRKGLGL